MIRNIDEFEIIRGYPDFPSCRTRFDKRQKLFLLSPSLKNRKRLYFTKGKNDDTMAVGPKERFTGP